MTVEVAVAGGVGDLGGVDVLDDLAECGGEGFLIRISVQIQQRRDALGDCLGGDDDNLLLGEGDALLRSHNDILVIGEHKHGLRGGAVDFPENIHNSPCIGRIQITCGFICQQNGRSINQCSCKRYPLLLTT